MADCGVASRRKADTLINEGAVQVNGKTVYELGVKVTPGQDRITVSGKLVKPVEQRVYIAFYKPENVLTSMSDPHGRTTVADYVQDLPMRVFPVGRLDWDTEGLLLLTNDGDFAQQISHPRASIPKTYLVKLNDKPVRAKLDKLLSGVTIPGGKATAMFVDTVKLGDSEKYAWVRIVITEGRNRQVRKMFEKIGYDVKKLKRIAVGKLELGHLRKGQFVFLGPKGIEEALSADWPQKKFDVREAAPKDFRPTRTPRPGKPPRFNRSEERRDKPIEKRGDKRAEPRELNAERGVAPTRGTASTRHGKDTRRVKSTARRQYSR